MVCLSDSTDVMAMLQCSAVAQQERVWELGFHIFHPGVHQACLVFLTARPKWFSHLSECGKANDLSPIIYPESGITFYGIGLTCIPSNIPASMND